ncbi:ATP-binding protein [Carboxylicivirga mesophila]|uniref:ATP-binding protein n=1 Tax=Carboxylicivirga mesophila TaxID=1166478 RepID=A0ABS5KAE1_9BACT|nr:AAA family ATPase [Carboxylicivirga mesophila]MBS2211478.1 ATP-binding protein [Carboxylicivirga mesophila]
MQSFFETHRYLLEHLGSPVRRELMNEIDWNHRLIGIKGARGVGKTTFLLDFAKAHFGYDKSCLYVNLNNLYFTERSIISFADEFRKKGGKTLILDQVYKYPEWSKELRYCYDNFDDLKIVFSGSAVMRLVDQNPDLKGCVAVYRLDGFSFRENLNLATKNKFQTYSLDEILANHEAISTEITSQVRPLAYFNDYLEHGYYPFFLEKRNYLENVVKNVNLILEIDISYLEQIELKYLPKLRKLLYSIAKTAPLQPNVSRLSQEIETSRATVMNYLNYLKNGRLINMLYEDNESTKKPSRIYIQNPNVYHSVTHGDVSQLNMNRTFFLNQLGYRHEVNVSKVSDFKVNNALEFYIGDDAMLKKPLGANEYLAHHMLEVGEGNRIPLWLFGFLY